MKEKIVEFYNGVFTYNQPKLRIEPQELVFELNAGESAQGSIVINSLDERRVKGMLYVRIPGMLFKKESFFARASRLEYTYRPVHFREGESFEERIWLETNAGEYELPVRIFMKGPAEEPESEEEEKPLFPLFTEYKVQSYEIRKGKGRSDEWRERRRQEAALVEIQMLIEKERRNGCTKKEADARMRMLVDSLTEAEPDSAAYSLLNAWMLLREDKREEAGWILRKYEKSRLYQQKEMVIRGLFLYVNSLFRADPEVTAASVAQLQKMYQRSSGDGRITAFLLELDPQLRENTRTRYKVLERQFRIGSRNRLFYQEAWMLLREDLALMTRPNDFALQVFGWAASHGLLTVQAAQAVAGQTVWLRKWSPFIVRLLKTCYRVSPVKETAGALCSVYIRGHKVDVEAFGWYQKGVELDAKITNLYEYFIYALPEDYPKLLPRQVLLYFHYHNTLSNHQKTAFYCNLVRYGTPGDPVFEEHRRLLQDFLLKQLRQRKLNESLAWLYGRCLLVETLEGDLLEALADLLFLRKLTCKEQRILRVEVIYEQLEQKITVPLAGGCAYIPVYTPNAEIALIDEYGNRYKKTVGYELKRVMIEPGFMEICKAKLKDHLGIKLHLLDGKGNHCIKEDNLELVWSLIEDERISESYRLKLKLELLEHEKNCKRLEKIDQRFRFSDLQLLRMSEKERALYIEILILLEQNREAFRLLEKTECQEVDASLELRLLQRLMEERRYTDEQLLPFVRQVFEKGVYTKNMVELLARECRGSTEELLSVWKAGERFEMSLPELEEHLVVQALFTEHCVREVFPVFLSMDERGADPVIRGAYLNYLSWTDFVKGDSVPEELFESLEYHLLWEDRLSEVAILSYLRQLSVLLLPTDAQKRLAGKLMKELTEKHRQFAFMQNLLLYMGEKGMPADQTVLEYRCDPRHKVVLHYVLEYHGKRTFDYVTECLYPICGGVFIRAFILFYGERLTWFFTETAEDGTTTSTECRTIENREEHIEGDGRYHRLCRMQKALDCRQERVLRRMMTEYEELSDLAEEKFRVR